MENDNYKETYQDVVTQHKAACKAYDRSADALDRENAAARRQRRQPDKRVGERCFAAYDLMEKLMHKRAWGFPERREQELHRLGYNSDYTPKSTHPHEPPGARGVNRFTRAAKTPGGDRGQNPVF